MRATTVIGTQNILLLDALRGTWHRKQKKERYYAKTTKKYLTVALPGFLHSNATFSFLSAACEFLICSY